jgi:hypothetical protein
LLVRTRQHFDLCSSQSTRAQLIAKGAVRKCRSGGQSMPASQPLLGLITQQESHKPDSLSFQHAGQLHLRRTGMSNSGSHPPPSKAHAYAMTQPSLRPACLVCRRQCHCELLVHRPVHGLPPALIAHQLLRHSNLGLGDIHSQVNHRVGPTCNTAAAKATTPQTRLRSVDRPTDLSSCQLMTGTCCSN